MSIRSKLLALSLLLGLSPAQAQSIGGGIDNGPSGISVTYVATANGMVCNDSTDDTTAFNALLTTVSNVGGGTIEVNGICKIAGAVVFPNNGAGTPSQPPIRITGTGASANYTLPNSAAGLDLQYNASVAKLDTRGVGTIEIDHLILKDGGSDCAPFIQTTNTTLYIHNVTFAGTASGASACNDAIVLGGTGTIGGGTSSAAFQGYGTVIDHVFFHQIRRGALFQSFANGVQFTNNTVDTSSGSNITTTISAATNVNPAVLTATGHGFVVGSTIPLKISGFTGNWAAANSNDIVGTIIDANTFSIPVDSRAFGAVTGSPVYSSGAFLDLTGGTQNTGGNIIVGNLIEVEHYSYFAHLVNDSNSLFAFNALYDASPGPTSAYFKVETGSANCRIDAGYASGGISYFAGLGAPTCTLVNAGNDQTGTGNHSTFPHATAFNGPVQFTSTANEDLSAGVVGIGATPFTWGTGLVSIGGAFTGTNAGSTLTWAGLSSFGLAATFAAGVTINSSSGLTINNNGAITSNGAANFSGAVTGANIIAGSGDQFVSTSRAKLYSPSDSNWVMWNNAQTAFSSLKFGGTTNSFPEFLVNGFGIQAAGAAGGQGMIGALGGTFSGLTACASGLLGMEAVVTDSTTATPGATITGSGSNKVKAICNSSNNWVVETVL